MTGATVRPVPAIGPGLDAATVLAARLAGQHLRGPGLDDVAAVVAHLGAVQAQEFHPALWGLARRVAPDSRPGAAGALAAFDDGALVRTHVLRPTWHVMVPDDARWLLELTAPRVHQVNGAIYRREHLDVPARAVDLVGERAARGPSTREEVQQHLAEHGVDVAGLALAYVLMQAELDRVVVSGPVRGRRHTYVPFDARVPAGYGPLGERFDREAALVELVRRYLGGRVVATAKDVAAWSGLTLTDVRRGLAGLGERVRTVPGAGALDGLVLHHLADVDPAALAAQAAPAPGRPEADLLQGYDELFMGYSQSRAVVALPPLPDDGAPAVPEAPGALAGGGSALRGSGTDARTTALLTGANVAGAPFPYLHAVTVDGRTVGRWRWRLTATEVRLDTQLLDPPTAAQQAAVTRAAEDLGAHLGLRAVLDLAEP